MKTVQHLFLAIFFVIFNVLFLFGSEGKPSKKQSLSKEEVVCSVSDFVVSPLTCEGEVLDFAFTFSGTDFGLNGYTVGVIDSWTQQYSLGDPQTFAYIALCNQSETFFIYDTDNPDCMATFEYGLVCCDCLWEAEIIQNNCQTGFLTTTFDIFYTGGSCVNYDPTLLVNGEPFPLVYNFNTQLYNTSPINSDEEFIIYEICSNVPDLQQCIVDTLANPCFEGSNNGCSISSFTASVDASSCQGELIEITFDFDATSFGESGYIVSDNTGFEQLFSISQDRRFLKISDCNENTILTIRDVLTPACNASTEIGLLCCPCEPSFSVNASSCLGDSFNLNIVLDSINGSCINYDWSLAVNGETIDLNQTNTGYAATGIQSTDSLIIYELCTLVPGLPECFIDTLVNPCFQTTSTDTCQLTSFTVTSDINSCRGEIIDLNFTFEGTSFGTNGYTVSSNTGFSQTFNLTDTTLITLLADCDEALIFTITDANDGLCTAVDTIAALCCPCEPFFIVNTNACVGDSFSINFVIDSINGSCINYDWSLTVNREAYDIIQTNIGYTVTGIQSADSLITYEFCTLVPGLPECYTLTALNPCFETIVSVKETQISDLVRVNMIHGQQITLDSKYDQPLQVFVYNVNGQQMPLVPILDPLQSATYDISSWPAGLYILKVSSNKFTSSMKLMNVR